MYISIGKKYFIHLTLMSFLLVCVLGFFGFKAYNQQKIGREVGNELYKALVVSGISNEDKMMHMNNIIALKKEPYMTIAKMYTADLYCDNGENDKCIKAYEDSLNSKVNEPFLRSLLLLKSALVSKNLALKSESEVYYFTTRLVEVLNELENLDSVIDNGELKSRVLTLRDSVAASRGVKSFAQELFRLYFSE